SIPFKTVIHSILTVEGS
ncbi:hypothetical protein G210_5157, partial [Candida maltosa Xu316]